MVIQEDYFPQGSALVRRPSAHLQPCCNRLCVWSPWRTTSTPPTAGLQYGLCSSTYLSLGDPVSSVCNVSRPFSSLVCDSSSIQCHITRASTALSVFCGANCNAHFVHVHVGAAAFGPGSVFLGKWYTPRIMQYRDALAVIASAPDSFHMDPMSVAYNARLTTRPY